MSTARVRRPFVNRLALCAVPALLAASLAVVSSSSAVGAGGNIDAITVRVLGSPIGNITSSPLTLSPTFAQTTTDYVLRCHAGINAIQLTLSAASSGKLAVDKNRGSSVTIQENLLENQAMIITGPARSGPNAASDQGDSSQGWGHTEYWIRCLPHDFPKLSVTKYGPVPRGWYLTANLSGVAGSWAYEMVLNNNGTPVWYQKSIGPHALNLTALDRTTLAWGTNAGPGFGADPNGAFEVFDLRSNTTVRLATPLPPTDFHELQPLANGDVMMLSTPLRSNMNLTGLGLSRDTSIVDCVVQEVDSNHHLVWQWRASDHISVNESTHPFQVVVNGQQAYDLFHCNSIDIDSATGNLLVCNRHTDAIYLINKLTGLVMWKMGGTPSNFDHAQILTIVGDPDGAFHAQHDARFQPDGNISLFDDQSWNASLAARAVVYHIDAAAGTATLVWSYQSPDGHNSSATGSFRRLHGGTDNVIGWGFNKRTALFTEVDAGGNVLLDVGFPAGDLAYRAIKVADDALDISLLRSSAGYPPP